MTQRRFIDFSQLRLPREFKGEETNFIGYFFFYLFGVLTLFKILIKPNTFTCLYRFMSALCQTAHHYKYNVSGIERKMGNISTQSLQFFPIQSMVILTCIENINASISSKRKGWSYSCSVLSHVISWKFVNCFRD